jgi:ectoine hydroxylase-related dioxygenase (phytanoyl-CoA dioxygenase family)
VTETASVLSDAGSFRDEGWTVVPDVIPPDDLTALRAACARFVRLREAEMDAAGTGSIGLSHRGRRYFVSDCVQLDPVVAAWTLGPRMAALVRALLGDDAYLFNDQFVVKCGGVAQAAGTPFSWHQDSGYIPYRHTPYLTVWCALDDVTEDNGTVYLLPFSQAGTRDVVPHRHDPATDDMVADVGGPGIPALIGAGGVACFSSTLLHRSGANTTPADRRVYLAQYSAEPLLTADGAGLWQHAVPFLAGGALVADPAQVRDVPVPAVSPGGSSQW